MADFRTAFTVSFLVLAPAGCGARLPWQKPAVAAPEVFAPPPAAVGPLAPARVQTAAALDRTTAAERSAALAPATGGQVLGAVVANLGNPAEQGFWLTTPLVTAPQPGLVRVAGGGSVQVDLRPATGDASQLSLAAFRALNLPLTALAEVTVLTR